MENKTLNGIARLVRIGLFPAIMSLLVGCHALHQGTHRRHKARGTHVVRAAHACRTSPTEATGAHATPGQHDANDPNVSLVSHLAKVAKGGPGALGLHTKHLPVFESMPREMQKMVLPEYIIEPPDVLVIEGIALVPRSPYRLRSLDVVQIQASNTLPEIPIVGDYVIGIDRTVRLGEPYGSVEVAGLDVREAEQAISKQLSSVLADSRVKVGIVQLSGTQPIGGEYLVGPDGTVTLGQYGNVSVVGLTVAEAKATIEAHLSIWLQDPIVSMHVTAFNSKVYYVVIEGGGFGDQVFRLPAMGNETVLDALSNVQGLSEVSSKRIWVWRPSPEGRNSTIMPVDWRAITKSGDIATNYQVLPGDRIFIEQDKLIALDTQLSKLITPLERLMGFSVLGAGTATRLSGRVLQGGGNRLNQGL